jgi:hypothetical protein
LSPQNIADAALEKDACKDTQPAERDIITTSRRVSGTIADEGRVMEKARARARERESAPV